MPLPPPKVTPPLDAVPGMICNRFAPMLAIDCFMRLDDPLPISITAITAAMPMMMPSAVRTERKIFRRSATSADVTVRGTSRTPTPPPSRRWLLAGDDRIRDRRWQRRFQHGRRRESGI